MAGKTSVDVYTNKFYGAVTESAASTLTFAEIPTNVSVFEKQAWVLSRLEWYLRSSDYDYLISVADGINLALTNSNSMTSLALNNPGVIDTMRVGIKFATAVGFEFVSAPIIRDFSGLPGGGVIIAPRPLYVAIQGVSIASACYAEVRGYFTTKTLSGDEYLELVDFYRIVS